MNYYELLTVVVYGVIQGLAEIFPISSSGHLVLYGFIWGLGKLTVWDAALLHIGSLSVIVVAYGRDAWQVLVGRYGWKIPFGILLVGIFTFLPALLLRRAAEASFERPGVVVGLLTCNGLILLGAGVRLVSTPGKAKELMELRWRDYALIGLVQGIAVLPGISRLGSTLLVGLLLGLTWENALRLSFIIAIPTILAALFVESMAAPTAVTLNLNSALGFLATLVASAGALYIMRWGVLQRRWLAYFGLYRIAFGIFAAILIAHG